MQKVKLRSHQKANSEFSKIPIFPPMGNADADGVSMCETA